MENVNAFLCRRNFNAEAGNIEFFTERNINTLIAVIILFSVPNPFYPQYYFPSNSYVCWKNSAGVIGNQTKFTGCKNSFEPHLHVCIECVFEYKFIPQKWPLNGGLL